VAQRFGARAGPRERGLHRAAPSRNAFSSCPHSAAGAWPAFEASAKQGERAGRSRSPAPKGEETAGDPSAFRGRRTGCILPADSEDLSVSQAVSPKADNRHHAAGFLGCRERKGCHDTSHSAGAPLWVVFSGGGRAGAGDPLVNASPRLLKKTCGPRVLHLIAVPRSDHSVG